MKNWNMLLLCFLASLFSCSDKGDRGVRNCSSNTKQMLLEGTVMTTASFRAGYGYKEKYYTDFLKRPYFKVSNEILGLNAEFYKQEGLIFYPQYIIYVSNGGEFEFSFPFNDEYEVLSKNDNVKNSAIHYKDSPSKNVSLYYSYAAYKMGLNQHDTLLVDLVKTLNDSLMRLSRVSNLQDFDSVMYSKDRWYDNYMQAKNRFVSNIGKSDVLYYAPKRGLNAIWEVKINKNSDQYPIEWTLLNAAYYSFVSI